MDHSFKNAHHNGQEKNTSAASGTGKPQIVRRKISLSKQHDALLQELAEGHFSDNKSECVRAAIAALKSRLEGESEERLRKIEVNVKKVLEKTKQMSEIQESDSSELTDQSGKENGTKKMRLDDGTVIDQHSVNRDMFLVHGVLAEKYPDGLQVNEITSSIDECSKTDVRHAIIDLQTSGRIIANKTDSTTRYEITGNRQFSEE